MLSKCSLLMNHMYILLILLLLLLLLVLQNPIINILGYWTGKPADWLAWGEIFKNLEKLNKLNNKDHLPCPDPPGCWNLADSTWLRLDLPLSSTEHMSTRRDLFTGQPSVTDNCVIFAKLIQLISSVITSWINRTDWPGFSVFAKTHLAELAGNSIKVPMLSMITILITTVYSYINIISFLLTLRLSPQRTL